MALFEVLDHDKKFYKERLQEFLPDNMFDTHTHIYETKKAETAATQKSVSWPSLVASCNPLEDMDETGKLEQDRYSFTDSIYISQKDIRALQTAKAAIAAGIKTLLYEMKKPVSAVKKVLIAGGFGMHIDPDSACDIGLIPDELRERIEFLGNCAGLGAINSALSREHRLRTEAFAKKLEYIELSGHKKFNELYIEEMLF